MISESFRRIKNKESNDIPIWNPYHDGEDHKNVKKPSSIPYESRCVANIHQPLILNCVGCRVSRVGLGLVAHIIKHFGSDSWKYISPSYNTRRGQDIEFTTDPNFFEQIFNVLTIVGTLEIAPRIYHEYQWVSNLHWMTIQYRKFLNLLLFFKWIINNLPFFCFLSSTYPKSRTFLADFRQKFKDLVPVLLKNWPLTPSSHSPAAPRPDPWSPRGTWPGPWSMVTKILSEFLPIDHWSRPDNLRKCYGLGSVAFTLHSFESLVDLEY